MIIGIVPGNPEQWNDWPQIRTMLEPAAKRGGVPVLEPDFAVWAVYEDGLTGAATVRITTDRIGEVVLVGGRLCRRWIAELDDRIADWLRDEGCDVVRAYGRAGWVKVLKKWRVIGREGAFTGYERRLRDG